MDTLYIEFETVLKSDNLGTRLLVKDVCLRLFSYFSSKTYVVGTQKNRDHEMVLLSTQSIW